MRRAGLIALSFSLVATVALGAPPVDVGSDAQRAAGKKLYDVNCSQCHGDKGDGQGIAYPFLLPKPRDFTAGKFKIRTTPSGSLPTTRDLKNTRRRGIPTAATRGGPHSTAQRLAELVYYVKPSTAAFAKAERKAD